MTGRDGHTNDFLHSKTARDGGRGGGEGRGGGSRGFADAEWLRGGLLQAVRDPRQGEGEESQGGRGLHGEEYESRHEMKMGIITWAG